MSTPDQLWRALVGPPLRARDVIREQVTPVEGLPALSLDALTSVAYGPEAIIVVLAVAGAGALHLVLPVTIAIVALLAILVFSYRQVIDAYPGGGGAYAVSRAGRQPGRRRRAGRRPRGLPRSRGRPAVPVPALHRSAQPRAQGARLDHLASRTQFAQRTSRSVAAAAD
jgi:hypothetical protein